MPQLTPLFAKTAPRRSLSLFRLTLPLVIFASALAAGAAARAQMKPDMGMQDQTGMKGKTKGMQDQTKGMQDQTMGMQGKMMAMQAPAKGMQAPDFTLLTPAGQSVSLASDTDKGTTVLVVLRGYPGYQCPYCVKQVHDFVAHAPEFAAKHVNVLLVYPGPPADLDQHAKEFLAKQADLPQNVQLVTDPDYMMTNKYGLRWDAPSETAYPSTFVLDEHRKILFEKISHSHGDRTTAEEVLAQIPAMM